VFCTGRFFDGIVRFNIQVVFVGLVMMLGLFHRLDIFFRVLVKVLFASAGTELIHLPFIFRLKGSGLRINVHAAYRIFYHNEFLSWAVRITQLYTLFHPQPSAV